MRAHSADTDPEAERIQIELLRQAGSTRRAQMALALSGQVIGLARQALRFVELHYGRDLADGVRSRLTSDRAWREAGPD
jgi:hypothetical protein